MDAYDEYSFKAKVEVALEKVKTILDNTRNPRFPSDVHHEYEDKYLLAEYLTTSALATFLSSLDFLGVNGKPWEQVKEWAKTRSVTLRLRADETCKFVKKVTRDQESDTKNVTKAGIFGKFESFTVTKITEYLWDYSVRWELVAFMGVDSSKAAVLLSHNGNCELKTSTEHPPKPETLVRTPIDVNITWLLNNTDDTRTPKFAIDRRDKKCRTPRRNPQVDDALTFFTAFHIWVEEVCNYFRYTVFPEQLNHGLDLDSLNPDAVFVPVIPLFEDSPASSSSSTATATHQHPTRIPPVFMNSFLAEQARSLEDKRKDIAKVFTANEKLITISEANLIVILLHLNRVSESYSEGVDFIEDMLYKQLVAAIGKEVTPVDFSQYLAFHNRKIFNEQYRPQAFSYAIRRPDHYPEGVLSIEAQLDDGTATNPITTIVAKSTATQPMKFSLNAATKVSFYGERYLHGYVSHQFAGYSGTELSLYARARQFSSFILLVGRIVSADLFEPKYATIIQNKDELKIPLLLETIPTPKEFKDAIESLSPEQQRFCKAFRSMQLESTLFGVCIIQIKPQLEKLLKLPDDSLTKEIQLSQELLSLFIKYQIPSDLVSYDGPANESNDFKTARVKEYVVRMNAMLEASKKTELEEAKKQQEMRLAQQEHDRRAAEEMERRKYSEEREMKMDYARDEMVAVREMSVKKKSGGGIIGTLTRSKSSDKSSKSRNIDYSIAPSSSARGGKGGPPMPKPMAPSMSSAAAPMMIQQQQIQQAPGGVSNNNNNNNVPVPESAPISPREPAPAQQQQQHKDELVQPEEETEVIDYTKVPQQLEQKFEEFDENNALRPTIINPGTTWNKTFFKSLLSEASHKTVNTDEQVTERNKAFDLLDALTKSGALSVDYAALHVVIAATHCFDKSIINTVVRDNINPIEKVENSSLIVASTIHQTSPAALVAPEHLDRIATNSAPRLFAAEKNLIQM